MDEIIVFPPGMKVKKLCSQGVFAAFPFSNKGRKKNLTPKAPENQEITTQNPLAKWGKNVYNSDRRKKYVENFKRQTFLKTKIREKDSCGVRQNRTI